MKNDQVLGLILAMSLVTMGSRLLGFLAAGRPSGLWARAFHYLPFGLFAAIVVVNAPGGSGAGNETAGAAASAAMRAVEIVPYLSALLVTAVSARRGAPIVLSLVLGWGAAWLARFAL